MLVEIVDSPVLSNGLYGTTPNGDVVPYCRTCRRPKAECQGHLDDELVRNVPVQNRGFDPHDTNFPPEIDWVENSIFAEKHSREQDQAVLNRGDDDMLGAPEIDWAQDSVL